jgi:hypothetical protein
MFCNVSLFQGMSLCCFEMLAVLLWSVCGHGLFGFVFYGIVKVAFGSVGYVYSVRQITVPKNFTPLL